MNARERNRKMVKDKAFTAEYPAEELRDPLESRSVSTPLRLYERATDSVAGTPWIGLGVNGGVYAPGQLGARRLRKYRLDETDFAGTFSDDDEVTREFGRLVPEGYRLDDRTGRQNGRPKYRPPSPLGLAVVRERIELAIDDERSWYTVAGYRVSSRSHQDAKRRAVAQSPARTEALAIVLGVNTSTIRRWRPGGVYRYARETPELLERRKAARSAEGPYPGGYELVRAQIHSGPLARYRDGDLRADDARRAKGLDDDVAVSDHDGSLAPTRRAHRGYSSAIGLGLPDESGTQEAA